MESVINQLVQWDGQILLLIQDHLRMPVLNPWVAGFTKLGNMGLLWIAISVILLIPKKTRRTGMAALISLLITYVIVNLLMKQYVARVRPYEVVQGLTYLIPRPTEHSFPSGHTASAFAAAVLIFKTRSKWIGIPCMIGAILMGLSRLYVGVHYPSDVLVGGVVGTLVALIMYWLCFGTAFQNQSGKKRKTKRRRPRKR